MDQQKPPAISRDAKASLARLMANENLTVEHRAVRTAYFDVERRVLTLPIWTDMTGDIYDTLVGHEIGHALETPASGEEILNAITSIDANNKHGVKMFLNVIEDARIEKAVRRRYPGMRRSFSLGYKQLLDRNFFGTIGRSLKTYKLIDRINLHFKLGSSIIIDFSPREMELVRMVENCETFSEVVDAAKAVYEYCKLHKEEDSEFEDYNQDFDQYNEYPDEDDFSSTSEKNKQNNKEYDENPHELNSSSSEDEDEDEVGEESNERDLNSDESDKTSGNDSDENDDGEFDQINDDKSDENFSDDFGSSNENPTSETQENWEKMKEKLLSGDIRGYQYVNIPEIDGHNWIVSYKQVHYGYSDVRGLPIPGLSQIVEAPNYVGIPGPNAAVRFKLLNKFKNENSPVISFMIKEFEMRKAASQYARQSISKTGVINTNKLHSYRYNDDIFRRITNVPNGKNHGLVMIIDWSGSMQTSMSGTIEQLLNLTIFCNRVQIPFEVFAFSDAYRPSPNILNKDYNKFFKHGDILIGNQLSLLQLLSSTMKPKEMNDAMGNLLAIRDFFDVKKSGYTGRNLDLFSLGGTPLNDAILCLSSIVNSFKNRNKLQIVNTIILTDGEDSNNLSVNDRNFSHYNNKQTILRDNLTKAEYNISAGWDSNLTKVLLQLLRNRTNVNVIGYYLISGNDRSVRRELSCRVGFDSLEKTFSVLKDKKFVELTNLGYNTYYIVRSEDLRIDSEELCIGKSTSTKAIAKAFGKYAKKKQENRIMLSRFIEKISVDISDHA